MKLRVVLNIDVDKLDRARFFKGKKGTYCEVTSFIDTDEPNEYGAHGFITQSKKKDEPKELRLPILGNTTVVWKEGQAQAHAEGTHAAHSALDDDNGPIPF